MNFLEYKNKGEVHFLSSSPCINDLHSQSYGH